MQQHLKKRGPRQGTETDTHPAAGLLGAPPLPGQGPQQPWATAEDMHSTAIPAEAAHSPTRPPQAA